MALAFAAPAAPQEPETPPRPTFAEWLAGVRAEALTRGIREDIVDAALAGMTPAMPTSAVATSAAANSEASTGPPRLARLPCIAASPSIDGCPAHRRV